MKRLMTVLLCAIPVPWAQAATLHLAGSSQLSDSGYPYYSWGTELGKYMSASHRVRNLAVSGASTKSYRESGKWKELIDGVEPGDFVGIQFGANDQKCSTEFYREKRWAAPDGLFRDILREWVGEVRAKGATPVLISHSGRCTFDAEGRKIVDKESAPGVTLGSYSASAKALSEELGCAFVDMQTMVRELSESLGREEAYKNYVISVGWRKGKDGEPSKDTTHPIKSGAEAQSRLFRADVTRRGLSVAKLFQRPDFFQGCMQIFFSVLLFQLFYYTILISSLIQKGNTVIYNIIHHMDRTAVHIQHNGITVAFILVNHVMFSFLI